MLEKWVLTCQSCPDADIIQETYKGDQVWKCSECENILYRDITPTG